ncbi:MULTISPECIES: helix-turn-helix transcriptional regulator [unclassified Isoptericola]|uniref:helix-turn-helix transcriptional regulator n=1 Tax=unclassified Isoptericola TaxID=2623355 RepID=UPI00365E0AD9
MVIHGEPARSRDDVADDRPAGGGTAATLRRLREDLRRADATVSGLLRRGGVDGGPDGPELVEVVDGREEQGRRVHELEVGARRTVWAFQSGANTVAPVTTRPFGSADDATERVGIRYRVLVDSAFLTEPAAIVALDARLAAGHQVRVVDQPLVKLAIADEETAMIQVSQDRSLLLRPPLVQLACELFETTWRRSRPYLREEGDLSPLDRRILQLMLSGLTDAATANQVGTSPRTVQRRVRALMDAAGVTSRIQLGWYAIRNFWV